MGCYKHMAPGYFLDMSAGFFIEYFEGMAELTARDRQIVQAARKRPGHR